MGGPRTPSLENEINLQHLQAELARVDVLIQREVRRWQLAGQDPGDVFRGLAVSDEEAQSLAQRPLSTSWGQTVTLPPVESQFFSRALTKAENIVQARVATAQAQAIRLRLAHLAEVFKLSRFELDVLLLCLAPALDLRYERIYGYLQDDITRKQPSVNLIIDLLCEPGIERWQWISYFGPDAPLFRHHLIEHVPEAPIRPSLLSQMVQVDPALVTWFLGEYQPHALLNGHARLLEPSPDPVDELLAAALERQAEIKALVQHTPTEMPILIFHGSDQTGQDAAARHMALRLNLPLLRVDLSAVIADGTPALAALRLAFRDARLTGALPYLSGWDACLESPERRSESESVSKRDALEPNVFAELCAYPGLVIVAGNSAWHAGGIGRRTSLFWIDFSTPPYPQRRMLWEHFLHSPAHLTEPAGEEQAEGFDLTALAGQFALSSGQIRDAIASARDMAAQANRPLHNNDLFASARRHSNPHLSSLARKIYPRYTWTDIILPDDQMEMLREIVATVRSRPVVLDEWGVGQKLVSSTGVPILFSGPPGTGKTMAAEVIAQELGLELYKIDLSTVVSKYIGETEKNLERIFDEAELSNAILFFDEADAIFGKRSEVKDAHDRYANVEVSYLLQRMEAYGGVTVLATNLRANLDEAFTRRLQFAVDFPFPEEEYRLRIWKTLFPLELPCAPDLDFTPLARRFKLAGGNIRNIIVSAAYLAAADGGSVNMEHLLHSTRRELQKMGRLINERELKL